MRSEATPLRRVGRTALGLSVAAALGACAAPASRTPATAHKAPRLPPEVIQRIVREHYTAFQLCYEKALAKDPNAVGKVAVRFVIALDGHVSSAKADASTFTDPDVVPCMLATYRRLVFPKPKGGTVTVVYPIAFSPG